MSLAESPLMLRRKLSPRSFLSAALVALPVLFVTAEARAQECAGDAECGPGFSCETVVTSVGSGVGGAAGTAGTGGVAGGSAGFAGSGGTGVGGSATGGFPSGGSAGTGSSTGGVAGTIGVGGTAGTGAPLPTVCNNAICQAGETPENCPNDCKYTTICATATCTSDSDCAADYYCPPVGSVGTGGGPNTPFCGDLLCTPGSNEDQFNCPFDCDPNYRRCTPGYRGCQANTDCPVGYVCTFYGGSGGASGSGGTGASGAPAGGQSSDEAPDVGGTGGTGFGASGTGFGGGAGTGVAGSGTGANGGSPGIPAEGVCTPGGGGSTGGFPSGGTGAVGNGPSGGTGGTSTGSGGTDRNSGDEGETIVTHGGCALARPNASSPFALLLVALAALLRFGRRRSS
jgi:hypothetical protein